MCVRILSIDALAMTGGEARIDRHRAAGGGASRKRVKMINYTTPGAFERVWDAAAPCLCTSYLKYQYECCCKLTTRSPAKGTSVRSLGGSRRTRAPSKFGSASTFTSNSPGGRQHRPDVC